MEHVCEFPECRTMATRFAPVFRFFHCEAHDPHQVVWPKFETFYVDHAGNVKKVGHKIGKKNQVWGKNYFKRK